MPHISNRRPALVNQDRQRLTELKVSMSDTRAVDDTTEESTQMKLSALTEAVVWLLDHYKKDA